MTLLPDDGRPTYHDPRLWVRLGPRIVEHYDERARVVIENKSPTFEDYRERMGYLAALRWVIAEARELTKVEG